MKYPKSFSKRPLSRPSKPGTWPRHGNEQNQASNDWNVERNRDHTYTPFNQRRSRYDSQNFRNRDTDYGIKRESNHFREENSYSGANRTERINTSSVRSGKRRRSDKENTAGEANAPVRLNRLIAMSGFCSRRKADQYIEDGSVKVNGQKITDLGTKIDPRVDRVEFRGTIIKPEKPVYILLNKPKNHICTTDDPEGRRTVMDLVRDVGNYRIFPVGRLDRNTTGILILTNDGELATRLMHPSYNISKVYRVILNRNLGQEDLRKLLTGLELEDGFSKFDKVAFPERVNTSSEVLVQIHSGKNHVIKRMFAALDYEVVSLDRIAFGPISKKGVARSHWRHLSEKEVNFLRMASATAKSQIKRKHDKLSSEKGNEKDLLQDEFEGEDFDDFSHDFSDFSSEINDFTDQFDAFEEDDDTVSNPGRKSEKSTSAGFLGKTNYRDKNSNDFSGRSTRENQNSSFGDRRINTRDKDRGYSSRESGNRYQRGSFQNRDRDATLRRSADNRWQGNRSDNSEKTNNFRRNNFDSGPSSFRDSFSGRNRNTGNYRDAPGFENGRNRYSSDRSDDSYQGKKFQNRDRDVVQRRPSDDRWKRNDSDHSNRTNNFRRDHSENNSNFIGNRYENNTPNSRNRTRSDDRGFSSDRNNKFEGRSFSKGNDRERYNIRNDWSKKEFRNTPNNNTGRSNSEGNYRSYDRGAQSDRTNSSTFRNRGSETDKYNSGKINFRSDKPENKTDSYKNYRKRKYDDSNLNEKE